uniref:Uncharacterized protein n=1 Tax=Anopheles farauti TaxID=69004 RepID=A0A182QD95_9DIPT
MWNIILWFTVLVNIASAVFVVEVNKLFKPCPHSNNNSPFPLDMSNFHVYLSENEKLVMNGNFTFLQDIYPPWGVSIYTHKLEHGEWLPTPYTKRVLNLCGMILVGTEIWFPITKHMQRTQCPFRKGHVETFDMIEIENIGIDDMLHDLVGDWRIFTDFSLGTVPHLMKISCTMNEFSILEH